VEDVDAVAGRQLPESLGVGRFQHRPVLDRVGEELRLDDAGKAQAHLVPQEDQLLGQRRHVRLDAAVGGGPVGVQRDAHGNPSRAMGLFARRGPRR